MTFKKINNQRKIPRRTLLAAGLLSLSLLLPWRNAGAEEQKHEHDNWLFFEPTISSSEQVEINNFYGSESIRKMPDYSQYWAIFPGDSLYLNSANSPLVSPFQNGENILKGVKYGTITFYSDLVNASKSLSKMEKLVMFSAMSGYAYANGYDESLENKKVLSQEDFFQKLPNILNYNSDAIGTCKHISSNEATLANDSRLRTTVATGTASNGDGHAYDISKLGNSTAVWDGGNIIILQTKDIEKALEIYQLCANSIVFQSQFFEDSKLKYTLITKDGENYADFLGYDSTTDTTKNALFNNLPEVVPFSVNISEKSYLSEKGLSSFGFFVNTGEIRGDSLTPLEKLSLFQAGYKGNFSSKQISGLSIRPELSLVFGKIQYKNETDTQSKDSMIGISGDTILAYNQKGLNLSLRLGYNSSINASRMLSSSFKESAVFFYDIPIEAGASFRYSNKDFGMQPYFISQFKILPSDFGTMTMASQLTELKTGIAVDVSPDKSSNISFDPYIASRSYENEFGADAKIKIKNIEFKIGGYFSKSSYDFAPDRSGINLGAGVSLSDKSKVSIDYNTGIKNYDGETSADSSFSVTGTISY